VVFVCEDNKWAISVDKDHSTAIRSNADRGVAYGVSGIAVTKNDAVEVFKAAGDAVARARKGGGATLIEVKTDRYLGHFQGDAEVYRPKDEVGELRKSDPIPSLGGVLRARGMLDDAKDKAIRDRVHGSVTKAFDFARQSPYPAPREALEHVFA
jgi:pyruvate dehydrogenase E1 component alpha subunit